MSRTAPARATATGRCRRALGETESGPARKCDNAACPRVADETGDVSSESTVISKPCQPVSQVAFRRASAQWFMEDTVGGLPYVWQRDLLS